MALSEDFELPIPKRQRLEQEHADSRPVASRLFAPFRTIGLVSPTTVPFTQVPLGTTTFQITTSIGRSIQTYDLRRGLNLVFLSRPQCPEDITATYAHQDQVFVAWGGGRSKTSRGIWVMKRGRRVGQLSMDETKDQEITDLLVFGTWIVGCGRLAVEVWRKDNYEHYTTILPTTINTSGKDSNFSGSMCTLPTFLNKLLVGCCDGSVCIYNISTARLVHNLRPPSTSCGAVSALTAGTAIGLLAIAYSDGSVAIVDVELEEVVIQLRQPTVEQPVTSITFRTDGAGAGDDGRQEGIMATASVRSGDITVWDLNRGGRVVGILRSAHEIASSSQAFGINKIEFLPGQPVIISTGLDNALRSWIFDQTPFSAVPRLLHGRSGHSAPVSHLRFLPAASDGSEAAGKWLLSAAKDRTLWGFSLRKDAQSTELSQGNVKHKAKKIDGFSEEVSSIEHLKAPNITAIACSLNRDGGIGAVGGPIWTNPKTTNAEEASMTGWESIITAHDGDRFARTWFWGRKKAGRWALETGDRQPVSTVAITACGTFGLVGSSGGSLDMYNLQSGIRRQRFPPRSKTTQENRVQAQRLSTTSPVETRSGHCNTIIGVVVDNLNKVVVSAGLDGLLIFWNFTTGTMIDQKRLESTPIATRYNPVSSLLSVACDDSCIRVLDMDTRRVVREFWGCTGQIYDHCFSHDGRWIVASSMDSIIRVFDLSTGHLVDAFKTATCTSLTFSSTGEFLATAHAGGIGINIWNNKALFAHIPSRAIDAEKEVIDLTSAGEFEAVSQLSTQNVGLEENVDFNSLDDQSEIKQLDRALLTLSITPTSKWQTLHNLETIRARNKPLQPPEKPKAAPFFLGSTLLNGSSDSKMLQNVADPAQHDTPSTYEHDKSRISRLDSVNAGSSMMSNLLEETSRDPENKSDLIASHLSTLNPSAADLEIRSLTLSEMAPFVRALTTQLKQRRNFELVNTWMSVFLTIHAEFVSEVDEIRDATIDFNGVMKEEEKRLSELVGWGRGVVDFLRSAR